MKVDCFSPGLVSSSGLFRNQNPIFSKIFDFAATYILKVGGRSLPSICAETRVRHQGAGEGGRRRHIRWGPLCFVLLCALNARPYPLLLLARLGTVK